MDPDETMGGSHDIWGWAFLPFGLQRYGHECYPKDVRDRDQLDADITRNLFVLTEMLSHHGPDRPSRLIAFAMGRGVVVPWLQLADADDGLDPQLAALIGSVAAKALSTPPARPSARGRSEPGQRPGGISGTPPRPSWPAQRQRARERWEHDDKRKVRFGLGKDTFDKLKAADFEGCRYKTSGSINRSAVARRLYDAIAEGERR